MTESVTEGEDNDEVVGGCLLADSDAAVLTLAGRLLERAVLEPSVGWAVKISVAKLLHVICRLPNKSADLRLEVTFTSARERYGDEEVYFNLSVAVEDDLLNVQYGGHYYHRLSGGDSFSVFAWSARPGVGPSLVDYSRSLGVVTALVDPTEVLFAMPNSLERCEIHVFDPENPLLGDEPVVERPLFAGPSTTSLDEAENSEEQDASDSLDVEDDHETMQPLVIEPVTADDDRLLAKVGRNNTYPTSAGAAYGIENCDGCSIDLATVGLFVDGSSNDSRWGNFCASCCLRHGVAVSWGKGQLYARQHDGSWRGVAGFTR